MTSRAPAWRTRSTTRDPRKPAPPVTNTRRPVQKLTALIISEHAPPLCSLRVRILYDNALARNPAGTGSVVRGLGRALAARPDVEFRTPPEGLQATAAVDVGQRSRLRRGWNALAHLQYYAAVLPKAARAQGCDLIVCPTPLGPLRGRTPSLITIHDLSPVRYPQTMDRYSRAYIRAMTAVGVARAAAICTVSHAVAAEVKAHYRAAQRRPVGVAYQGPNPDLLAANALPAPGIDGRFLLMVGTLEPRKNHLTVLEAFADHRRRAPESDLSLVMAGSPGWRYHPVLAAIERLGLASRVRRLGVVEPGTLKWLYQNAQALLFPSLYEGFGIPVLEGFALGCPVVASRIPAVVEVAGSAAWLLDPLDVPAWSQAIDAVAAERLPENMRAAGLQRAQQFTWEDCASSVVALLQCALKP